MPTKRINQILSELSFERKLLALGSVLMIIALFLPWYKDLDSFKTGDMFLGITGPLALLGFTLLILAGINIALMVYDFLGMKLPFSMKSSNFYLFAGISSFYLLIAVNSVYFHAQFGVNITLKQSMFGMFVAFIAASFITIGGYLAGRDKQVYLKEFEESTRETVAEMPDTELRKPKGKIRIGSKNEQREVLPDPETMFENQPYAGATADSRNVESAPAEEPNVPPQPFRTDL